MEGELSREQCRAARALLDWSQADLAEAANLGRQTVVDFERGARTPHRRNLYALRRALEMAGIIILDENGEGVGARRRKSRRKKSR
jgi:transcriptional regulator with XRE-family HTH domain